MRHKKDETPSVRGKGFQETSQTEQTVSDCATLGSDCSAQAYQFPTELALCDLPAIPSLPGHGHRRPRAGGADLTEAKFQNALAGFVLGETIFEFYSQATTVEERHNEISNGIQIALDADTRAPGIMRGFAAYLAELIQGYAALAQGPLQAQEVLQ